MGNRDRPRHGQPGPTTTWATGTDYDMDNFSNHVEQILQTNYWGTKKVITAFWRSFNPDSRIVNITSHLAHVMTRVSSAEEQRKKLSRTRFGQTKTIGELDNLVIKFQRDADRGRSREEDWPTCAYSVSKMAINTYTRLLQVGPDTFSLSTAAGFKSFPNNI